MFVQRTSTFELAADALANVPVRGLAIACVLLSAVPAAAQLPVAVVEDVSSKTANVEFMDYVPIGKVIHLGPQGTMVLGYMRSCWRETINGGTVTVGAEQSDVQHGQVERLKVNCDGGRLMLTAELGRQAAGMVFRGMPSGQQSSVTKPQITLYGLSPIVEMKGGGLLEIERIDRPGPHIETTVSPQQLVNGVFYDLAKAGTVLDPGGIYRAKLGSRQLIFAIDPNAKPGASPIVGRLLRLQPAS
jgi:hypothetical protein